MIPRYARPDMTALWEAESRFSIWLEIETHALDAMVKLGIVPEDAAKAVREKGGFDVDRIDEIEREVKHDVIAFSDQPVGACWAGSALCASGHDLI